MVALMISTITVKNEAKLGEYLPKVSQLGARYGAELVFRGPAQGTITGALDHQMSVIVRFPSVAEIDALFASNDYKELISLREEAADMTIVKYEQSA
ncbi:MAG: DUF1330 domain-containing protein [Cognatishimia sp.]|uniref:DUF1330 domain-containing protein n=1 Tax=Cognatishimia sp. TaxID=2211648 RepID=UPI003B8CF479